MKLLDMNTVAKRIGCSKGHVSKLINGKVKGAPVLPCVRVGRRVVVIESTLEEWLKDSRPKEERMDQKTSAAKGFPQEARAPGRSPLVAPPVAQAR